MQLQVARLSRGLDELQHGLSWLASHGRTQRRAGHFTDVGVRLAHRLCQRLEGFAAARQQLCHLLVGAVAQAHRVRPGVRHGHLGAGTAQGRQGQQEGDGRVDGGCARVDA